MGTSQTTTKEGVLLGRHLQLQVLWCQTDLKMARIQQSSWTWHLSTDCVTRSKVWMTLPLSAWSFSWRTLLTSRILRIWHLRSNQVLVITRRATLSSSTTSMTQIQTNKSLKFSTSFSMLSSLSLCSCASSLWRRAWVPTCLIKPKRLGSCEPWVLPKTGSKCCISMKRLFWLSQAAPWVLWLAWPLDLQWYFSRRRLLASLFYSISHLHSSSWLWHFLFCVHMLPHLVQRLSL